MPSTTKLERQRTFSSPRRYLFSTERAELPRRRRCRGTTKVRPRGLVFSFHLLPPSLSLIHLRFLSFLPFFRSFFLFFFFFSSLHGARVAARTTRCTPFSFSRGLFGRSSCRQESKNERGKVTIGNLCL